MVAGLIVALLLVAAQTVLLFWGDHMYNRRLLALRREYDARINELTNVLLVAERPELHYVLATPEEETEAVVRPLKPIGV